MTLVPKSALLHGRLSNGPSGTEKKTSTHTRGDTLVGTALCCPTLLATHVHVYSFAERLRCEKFMPCPIASV